MSRVDRNKNEENQPNNSGGDRVLSYQQTYSMHLFVYLFHTNFFVVDKKGLQGNSNKIQNIKNLNYTTYQICLDLSNFFIKLKKVIIVFDKSIKIIYIMYNIVNNIEITK